MERPSTFLGIVRVVVVLPRVSGRSVLMPLRPDRGRPAARRASMRREHGPLNATRGPCLVRAIDEL